MNFLVQKVMEVDDASSFERDLANSWIAGA